MIPDDVRSTMLKYLDDARQSKEVIARHPATAEHKARAESEIARLTTAIEWTLHQSSQRALVPSTELDAAHQRIADLEAEVERLRAEPTEPTLDEMILAISERKLPFVLQGWGRTWWVDYWDNRTVDQPTPSEAIRAAWEAVCKEEA